MARSRLRRVGAASVTAVLLAAGPATMAAAAPGDGIGDPYFPTYGNTGYDIEHYDLRLNYQPDTDRLSGTATLVTEATEDLDKFSLDFLLDVRSIRVNGKKSTFESDGDHKVIVTPKAPVDAGDQMTVVVKYADVPSSVKWSKGEVTGWHRSDGGAIALGEPEVAWWWFPSNDHPLDKATFDVRVSVPEDYKAVSNGVLTGQFTRAGRTVYLWRQDQPAATYLATLAVGKYEVNTGTTASGLPVYNAYDPGLDSLMGAAKASIERSEEILEFQEQDFGPYPFNALGGIVAGPDSGLGFALETQTRPVYSHAFFARGSNPYVVAHELAHQWWGNHVSVARWQDIWLNEGFASYAEWMLSEHEGEGTVQEIADYVYDSNPEDDPFWQVKPGDPGADNVFHSAVYDRGALAVHALRMEVGEAAFADILTTWQQEHANGNATVEEFIELAEKVSGQDLTELFDTWLYTEGRPAEPPAPQATTRTLSAPAGDERPKEPKSWKKIKANHDLMHREGHAHAHAH
ncbi:peptidase [Nocardiopsis gilva YIM 90087]|uniref:Aminopeptidase N n=1 Tax=Nocardiopsis gilva YIM 90087 TaxID=1235441 RepID=A0A223SC05_9ACTN|nr:M1 family metallopeptidase [Nocardiopsis gilva]ASU85630.1 peptidase [Nocardiopsis gilva YIM 90087]